MLFALCITFSTDTEGNVFINIQPSLKEYIKYYYSIN